MKKKKKNDPFDVMTGNLTMFIYDEFVGSKDFKNAVARAANRAADKFIKQLKPKGGKRERKN